LERVHGAHRARRGIALFVALFFVAGVGALALSAIYLTATATLLGKTYDKEDDLKYAVEAALAMGKAHLNYDATALPTSGFDTLMLNAPVKTADGSTVPGVTVTMYAGLTGSTTGQFGRFASLVAQAKDLNGTGFVRRLELSQESFAKYAYWTNSEGSGISFGGGDQIWGPVWSNDDIDILSSGAEFHDAVGTAGVITGVKYGTFSSKGYSINQKSIPLPSTTTLSTLSPLATVGGMNFPAVTTGDETGLLERIEFVAADILGTGDSSADNDGFFRVYQAKAGQAKWLRGDYPTTTAAPTINQMLQCGDWHKVVGDTGWKFFPLVTHYHASPGPTYTWFDSLMAKAAGVVNTTTLNNAKTEANRSVQLLMQQTVGPRGRCYLGGDPHLVAVARVGMGYADTLVHKGGDDTTFTANDAYGKWLPNPTSPNAAVATARKANGDANYLYPIYRGYNPGTKSVIYVGGTVGISGVLRGSLTLYSPYDIVVLDDLRYVNDPAKGVCVDILGVLAGKDVVVADNALNSPQVIKGSGTSALYQSMDDNQSLTLQAVVMALNTSFRVEDYDEGSTNALTCDSSVDGRGCLYLTGGIIQKTRGAVGTSAGYGYTKRYSYDRCAVVNPPPYFPTTGRFQDNRYYELDPVKFNVTKLFQALTPGG
jgi:hypothetical protein